MYYITAVAHMHGAALWALHFSNTIIKPKIEYGYQPPSPSIKQLDLQSSVTWHWNMPTT